MNYAELYCQSNFSFLTGASHPEELIVQACRLGYRALAITDECSVAGVVRAYEVIKAEKLPIKLIVGASFKFEQDIHLILLAPSRLAYAELCRVITNARRRCEKGGYQLTEWDIHSIKHCIVLWLPSGDIVKDTRTGKWLTQYHQQRLYLAYYRTLSASDNQQYDYQKQLANTFSLSSKSISLAI